MKPDCNIKVIQFKDIIDSPCGIRYMFDSLNIYSGYSRLLLLQSHFMQNREEIENYYALLKEFALAFSSQDGDRVAKEKLQHLFCDLKDIGGSLERLLSGAVLDDIELFEVKALAMLSEDIRYILEHKNIKGIVLPEMKSVISILDPDGLMIRSFYVYDSYSVELANVRSLMKHSDNVIELEIKEKEIEYDIRKQISYKLRHNAEKLINAMRMMGKIEILLAKSEQIFTLNLCFPSCTNDGTTLYKGLFHPLIKEKGYFMPIDISFAEKPVIITGANMGGKTVTLMMCALTQYLFQFGFGIPALSADIDIKQNVYVSMGDGQNISGGYSSFAAEILSVNAIIKGAEIGEHLLALIDEPARTTNPVEGSALVEGLLERILGYDISTIISTHYNVKAQDAERLRVRGFIEGKMDYRLVEVNSAEVPHEAVKIARSLGVDEKWLEATEKYIN